MNEKTTCNISKEALKDLNLFKAEYAFKTQSEALQEALATHRIIHKRLI